MSQQVEASQETTDPASSATGSTTETSEPLIELGEFNADNDEFVLFDPCTEIPWEVYEAVGFSNAFGDPRYDPSGSISCSFESAAPERSEALFVVTADEVPFERLTERGLLIDESPASELPGSYTHHMGGELVDSCTAAVHTTKGRLTMFVNDWTLTDNRDALCNIAVDYLEKIYQHTGGV